MTSQRSLDVVPSPDQKKSRLAVAVATFFYAGYVPRAPGTFASALTVLLWVPPILLDASPFVRVLSALLLFAVGVWASQKALPQFAGQEDPSAIVIDEVAGQTLALALCPANALSIAGAFVLFRFFDILKPGPIRWLDKNIKGGLGIMLDDMLAGLVSVALLFILRLT